MSRHEADSYWMIFPITQATTTTIGITMKRIIVLFILGDYLFIWGYSNNFATNSRKAPAFLQGLLHFGLFVARPEGFEPPTLWFEVSVSS
jgi:hypothetical protein